MLSVDTDILKSTDLLLNPKLFLRIKQSTDDRGAAVVLNNVISLCCITYEWLLLSGWSSWLGFCPINRPCVLMCSEVHGEEATAGTLLFRPSENVAVPKVHKHMHPWLNTLKVGSLAALINRQTHRHCLWD